MADSTISGLTALTTPAAEDLLVVVDDPSGSPVNKKITLRSLFGNVTANVSITGNLSTSANNTLQGSNTVVSSNATFSSARPVRFNAGAVTLTAKTSVSSNNATTQLGSGGMQGSMFWDENYLYVATSNTVIKRVALSTFAS